MSQTKITFCNTSYAKAWFKNLKRQNRAYYRIVVALVREIEAADGGDLDMPRLRRDNPWLSEVIARRPFKILPVNGQMLKANGEGIRHAKFAPSKSIAIIWAKIGEDIFVTFDDHAPLAYHRAISHLRDISLGRPAFPKKPRMTGSMLRGLREFRKRRYLKKYYGFDPRLRYYE